MEIIIILLILSVIIIQIIGVILQNKNNKLKNIEMIDILNKNTENQKEIFLQIENSLALKNKNTLLEGLQDVSKKLSQNNENLLVRFNDFGINLSRIVAENNKILTKDINIFKDEFKNSLTKDCEQLNLKVESKLEMINLKVEDRLTKGFEQTTKTFNHIIERLSKIDEAQKKID
mgnify:FL=1